MTWAPYSAARGSSCASIAARSLMSQDLDVAGLLVDLDIADMRRKTWPRALRIDRHLGTDRPAGPPRFERDLGQRQRLEATGVGAGGERLAVPPFDRVGGDVP